MSTLPSSPLSVILNVLHTDGSWFLKTLVSQLPSYFWNSAHVFLGEREVECWIYLSYKCIITLSYSNNSLFLLRKHNLCKEMKVLSRHICVWCVCINVYTCMCVAKISIGPENWRPRHLTDDGSYSHGVWRSLLEENSFQLGLDSEPWILKKKRTILHPT